MPFKTKRIYDPAAPADGTRVLVDRLWPRGVSKQRAALATWLKDVAPSPALREWFGHEPGKFDAFRAAYTKELATDAEKQTAVQALLEMGEKGTVTLLYGAKSPTVNHAVVLRQYLEKHGAS